jgi:hypothetical protein
MLKEDKKRIDALGDEALCKELETLLFQLFEKRMFLTQGGDSTLRKKKRHLIAYINMVLTQRGLEI